MLKSLSLIIPAYNEEHHLRACLDSVAAQSVMPDEVIVVDNNSSDATAAIASEFPFVTLLNAPQQGVVYARNVGFNAAKGDIIGRIDADVRLPKQWCEQILQFYTAPSHSNHIFTGGVLYYNLRLPRLTAFIQNQFVFRLNRLLMGHYIVFGSNAALPRAVWHKVRPDTCDRTDIHEDLDLSIHLHRQGYAIEYRPGLVTNAKMRRVFTNRHALLDNLLWWPRTLRVHHIQTWPVAYAGAIFLYTGTPVLTAVNIIGRYVSRKSVQNK